MPKSRSVESESSEQSQERSESVGWLKTGYDAVRDHIARTERERVRVIRIKEDETRILRFLDALPSTAYRHDLKVGEYYRQFTCLKETGEDCPLCEAGIKRSFRGGYTAIDRTPDKEGRMPKPDAYIFSVPTNSLKLFEKCNNKYGLLGRDTEVSRIGTGAQTIYSPQPGDKRILTDEEKKVQKIDFAQVWKPLSRKEMLALVTKVDDEDEVEEQKSGNGRVRF